MSVTHVIPGGLTEGRRVNSPAIPAPLRFRPRPRAVPAVTSGRAPRVGWPTIGQPANAVDVDPLVVEAAAAALESLDLIERRALEAALDFRWSRVAQGQAGLADLVNGVQSIVRLAVSAAESTGIDLEFLCDTDGRGASEATRHAVHRLIADQDAGDWAALASTLQQQFIPALASWRAVFQALTGAGGDFDPSGRAA
jgi:hypothetical protein